MSQYLFVYLKPVLNVICLPPGAVAFGSSLAALPVHPNCATVHTVGILQIKAAAAVPSSSSSIPTLQPPSSPVDVALACEGVRDRWVTWSDGRWYKLSHACVLSPLAHTYVCVPVDGRSTIAGATMQENRLVCAWPWVSLRL